MLNEKLFADPKDAEIARLKMTIEKFKEYDKERKKYYADKMLRLGELESYIDELESTDQTAAKLARCQTELKHLQNIMRYKNIKDELDPEDLQNLISNLQFKEKQEEMQSRIKEQARTISQLLQENNNLKNKIKRIEQLVKLKEDKQ